MNTISKGILFLNNLNLSSNKNAPEGRLDSSFEETLRSKISYVTDYAKENELQIVIFGDTFKSNFEVEAFELFLDCFGDSEPLLIESNKPKRATSLLQKTGVFEVVNYEGMVAELKIESIEDIEDVQIYYTHQLPKGFTGVSVEDGFSLSAKSIVVSSKYTEIDDELCTSDAIVFGQWESVSNSNESKHACNSIVRHKSTDPIPSFLVWDIENGLSNVEIEHQEIIFEDSIDPERESTIIENKTEFARSLKLASQASSNDSDLGVMVTDYIETASISQHAKDIIQLLAADVA
ncbi:hypothetical protein LMH73_003710 [Vibrio splendidus]|nr:hypothetical protein [Vibrio splendidus]MCC4882972.1 hypothetical protein [Vibrio splendidus]